MNKIDSDRALEVVKQFFDAGNRQNLERLAELVAPTLTVSNPLAGQQNVVPREAFSAALENMKRAFPDLRMHVVNMVSQGDTVVTEEMETATLATNGKSYKMPACIVMRVNADGQICESHNYWDTQTMFSQLGIDLPTYGQIIQGRK